MKHMTLEQVLSEELADMKDKELSVIAHELWGNRLDGYETNNSWYLSRRCSLDEAIEAARGRWEVFKVNYAPRATVKGLSFDGDESTAYIESDGIPFLEIRVEA